MNRAYASSRVLWEQTRESHIKTGKKKPLRWRWNDEMMTAARENLDPKIQSRFSGLSTLHLPLSLAWQHASSISHIINTRKRYDASFFSLTHEQRHRHHHHRHQKEMMMMMIKEDHRKTTAKEEEEENAPWKYSRFDSELPGCNKSTPPHSRRTRLTWPSLICRLSGATRWDYYSSLLCITY